MLDHYESVIREITCYLESSKFNASTKRGFWRALKEEKDRYDRYKARQIGR